MNAFENTGAHGRSCLDKPAETPPKRRPRPLYDTIQLNTFSERGWAVIDRAGAIVLIDGEMLFRLSEQDAKRLAASLCMEVPP